MAGETSIERGVWPLRHSGEVATGWLLGLWTLGLTLTTGGATWALWLWPGQILAALIVCAYSFVLGAPLFLLTWFWLSATAGFRHTPFLTLVGVWLGAWLGIWLPQQGRGFVEHSPFSVAICALLPAGSCAALLLLTAQARSRHAEAAAATSSRAT